MTTFHEEHGPLLDQRKTWSWRTYNGTVRTVQAVFVTFESSHVVFWNGSTDESYLVLAVHNEGVTELSARES